MSYNRMGDGIGNLITIMIFALCIAIPLAIWKLVEIAIWLWNHVSITTR